MIYFLITGDDFISTEDELKEDISTPIVDKEETPNCCNFVLISILGVGLGFIIITSSLGLMALGLFLMIPIEQWVENYNSIIQILIEITLFLIFILLFPIIFYTIGFINRYGVERIAKTKLPTNRKWTILSGLIVYVIDWLLIYNIFGFTMQVEHSESYWIGMVSYAIVSSLEWFCIFLVGGVGYLVAVRLSLFGIDKQQNSFKVSN